MNPMPGVSQHAGSSRIVWLKWKYRSIVNLFLVDGIMNIKALGIRRLGPKLRALCCTPSTVGTNKALTDHISI